MFARTQPQQYRFQSAATDMRQRVDVAADREMSAALKRSVIIALCTALILVFVVSQLFYWKIMESHKTIVDLQTTISLSSQATTVLAASRDRLLTPERIRAVAAVRLDLHVPGDNQVHRF